MLAIFLLCPFFPSLYSNSNFMFEYSLLAKSPPTNYSDCLLETLVAREMRANFISISFKDETTSSSPLHIISIYSRTQFNNTLSHISLHFTEDRSHQIILLVNPTSGIDPFTLKLEVEAGLVPPKVLNVFDLNSQVYVLFCMNNNHSKNCSESQWGFNEYHFSIWEIYSIKGKPFFKFVESVHNLLVYLNQNHNEKSGSFVRRQNWDEVPFTAGVFVDFDSDSNKYEIGVHPNKAGLNGKDYKLTSSYSSNIYWDLQFALNFTQKLRVFDGSKKFVHAFQEESEAENQADIVLSHFGVTDEKRNIAQALRPTFFSGINAYFIQPPGHSVRNIYAKPFSVLKWSIIFLTWVLIGIMLHTLHYLQNTDDDLKHLHLNWWLIASACQQGCSSLPSSFSSRCVIITGLLFSYMCCNIFTATIVSDLWSNVVPIKNLEMLLSHSKFIYMSKDSDASNLIVGGMKQFAPQLLAKVKFHNLTTAFWKVSKGEESSCLLAWPDYFTGSGRKLFNNGKNNNVDRKLCEMFSSFQYKPFPLKVSMFVRKGSPFTPILNYRISVGLERGLISRYWRRYEMNTRLECVETRSGTTGRVLEMLDIVLAFLILVIGFGISLVMLVIESFVNSGVRWYHVCNQL